MIEEKNTLLEVDIFEHCLNGMVGRLGMVPFLSKIMKMLDKSN
jgi:hypothetical protein